MGLLFSFAYDAIMRRSEVACLADHRRELLAGATGDVLEIGAGTGANLTHYPGGLGRLVLSEPEGHMRARLARALALHPPSRSARVEIASASADRLPYDDASFDAVVSTLVLCTVPDLPRALAELSRVLRPGGALLFLEHVAAEDDPATLRWQRLAEPLWRALAGGCHVSRRTGQAIRDAGFVVEREDRSRMRKAVRWVEPLIRGVARKAGGG
jgi:ubiquinone/menaquinone biosynthesis C-methylase UbiE